MLSGVQTTQVHGGTYIDSRQPSGPISEAARTRTKVYRPATTWSKVNDHVLAVTVQNQGATYEPSLDRGQRCLERGKTSSNRYLWPRNCTPKKKCGPM